MIWSGWSQEYANSQKYNSRIPDSLNISINLNCTMKNLQSLPCLGHAEFFSYERAGVGDGRISSLESRSPLQISQRVVELTLNTEGRKLSSANRLPEKGNMDCVPYTKIDFLYNLMGVIASRKGISLEAKEELLSSRNSLESCLETHFRLLKISEEGLHSARIVS